MKQVTSHQSEQHLQALAEHAEWEWMLGQVVEFRQQHGHEDLGSHPAGLWLKEQRGLAAAGKLSALKRLRLEECGISLPKEEARRTKKVETMDLPKEEADWERLYSRLDAWQAQHGHCEVPRAWAADPELARWVQDLKRLRAQRRLTRAQESRLEALGFIKKRKSAPKTELWEERYAEMVAYQKEHGHTNVKRAQNGVLKHWRDVQREFRRKGMLSADRIARLDAIGFEWEAPGRAGMSQKTWVVKSWETRLDELKVFRERFGHCQVPMEWAENVSLAGWVGEQRHLDRKGRLSAERRARLDELGFVWKSNSRLLLPPFKTVRGKSSSLEDKWELRYAEMVVFQKEHGHTDVTKHQNSVLGRWRHAQREFYKAGRLSAERIARLEEIGFTWES